MNTYQVILQNSDVLLIQADSVTSKGDGYLNFYERHGDVNTHVAGFQSWQGWKLNTPEKAPIPQAVAQPTEAEKPAKTARKPAEKQDTSE